MLSAALDLASYVLRLPAPSVPDPSPPRASWLLGHFPDLQAALADGSVFGLITLWARTHAPQGATFLAIPGGERWVIVANDACIAAMYRDPDGVFGKTVAWKDALSELAPRSLVPNEGAYWRRHRKLVAHAFSHRHLVLAAQQGDVSCRRLLRGLTEGASGDVVAGRRVAEFDAADCFMAVFLDVQGVANLRADFGGVAEYLAAHGYPSGLTEGAADPLAASGVSSLPPATEGAASTGVLAASTELSGLLQQFFLSPKPLWSVTLPWGALTRAGQLREYLRNVARQVLAARKELGGGAGAASASPDSHGVTDLAGMLLTAAAGSESAAAPASGRASTDRLPPLGDGALSVDEVVDDTVALMWAATETSGATIGWLIYLMCADTDHSLVAPPGSVRCMDDLMAPEAARSSVRTRADVAAGTLPPPPPVDTPRPAAPFLPGRVWARLTEEVSRVVGLDASAPIPPDALESCAYVKAVLDEVLRLCPLGSNARRVVRDSEVCGVRFCTGDMVLMPMGCLHYDSSLWGPRVVRQGPRVPTELWKHHIPALLLALQGEFAPERWLRNPPADLALPRNLAGAYFPFGGGTIGCPGNRFAIAQMRAVIVRLVQTFECVRLAPDAAPVRIFQKLVATARDGIRVQGLLRAPSGPL